MIAASGRSGGLADSARSMIPACPSARRTGSGTYAHGFARVAACTADVWITDPSRNAAGIAAVARRCSERGVAVALFPELSLTGYAIDDLLGQQALLDAALAALGELAAATADLLPVIVVGAPLRSGTGWSTPWWCCTGGRCWAWCPRSTCRRTGSSTSGGSSPPAPASWVRPSPWPGCRCPSTPTCCSPRPTCPA
jgi:hypothetical protein